MIQFTQEDIDLLRKKALDHTRVIEELRQETADILKEPVLVPKEGIGNWTLYYYCPVCSVELVVDRHSPNRHGCPICGRTYGGEPYDSAWWGHMHMENYNGAFMLGILYLLTGEEEAARKAVDILCSYAAYYEGYAVHGDIPYNGPGKACAQTLDEALLLRTFVQTYDLVEAVMEPEEKEGVLKHFFLPGAKFLMEHRNRQLHNHEVIIQSAIAILGLLFESSDVCGRLEEEYHIGQHLVSEAVYGSYGLIDQLERGMLPDGMWFEGSFGYHFFALASFFAYEKFAIHTKHSHITHPNYRRMMETPVYYRQPDGLFPMLNDTTYEHYQTSFYLYEFAYRETGSMVMRQILSQYYETHSREHLEALLYGVDGMNPVEVPKAAGTEGYHTPLGEPGHTILRGRDGRYLLLKHDTYGGEHDHYDRLGLSFLAYGKRICADLGTTGYGALLHYDYFKNTGTHNTVMIGEENQPPAAARLDGYREEDGITYVEMICDWKAPYEMPDSFTIVQWKREAYQNVRMIRKIAWADTWFAELFLAEGVEESLPTDWVIHCGGKRRGKGQTPVLNFSDKKPFKYLKQVEKEHDRGLIMNHYEDGKVCTDVYSLLQEGELYLAKGPDNPSYEELNYLIERRYSRNSLYLHVFETYCGEKEIKQVKFEEADGGSAVILVEDKTGIHSIKF